MMGVPMGRSFPPKGGGQKCRARRPSRCRPRNRDPPNGGAKNKNSVEKVLF